MKKWAMWTLTGVVGLLLLAGVLYFVLNPFVVPFSNSPPVTPGTAEVSQKTFIAVTNVSPLNFATNQNIYANVVVTFDEAMDTVTVNQNTFTITGPNNMNLNGTITHDATNKVWTFNPTSSFKLGSVYTITVTTGAKGVSGNSLENNFVASFTTLRGGSSGESSSTVTLVLTAVSLSPATTDLAVGEGLQMVATGLDQNGNSISATITYNSTNTTVANVSSTGLVIALVTGNTIITSSSGTINDTSTITVTAAPALTYITLSPQSPQTNITINSTKQMTAAGLDQFFNSTVATINYTSSNTTVATVNSTTGLVTALVVGSTTINASSGTVSNTSIIYVVSLSTINLLPSTKNLTINTTVQMNATDNLGNQFISGGVNYTSTNTTVATINASGFVNALALGNTTINVSTWDGTASNTSIIYVVSLLNITLSPASANLTFGATKQMNSTDQLNNSFVVGAINYTSSNTTVAYVNITTGRVTANATAGNTTITALSSTDATINDTSIIYVLASTNPASCLATAVDLGTAGNFVILSKSGISTTGTTSITGNLGISPAAASYITGFGLIRDSSNTFSTSSLVTGNIYAADYTAPTPATMTTAIADLEIARADAASGGTTGRIPCFTELGDGIIGGLTFAPGVYKWSTGVTIPTNIILQGNATDIWLFQIAQTLEISSATNVTLGGTANASNVFWQVTGQTTLGTTSVFNGNIIDATAIVLNNGAKLNGKALAQTAVTLDANNVTKY